MNNKGFYLIRHIITKKNIILFIIFSLISASIMFCLSLIIKFNELKNVVIKNNVGFRTLIVSSVDENYDSLESIEFINVIEDSIFKKNLPATMEKVNNKYETSIYIKSILDKKSFYIVKGSMAENSGEVICPNKFYPYELDSINGNLKFDKNKIVNMNDALNKKIYIQSENDKNLIKEFKIVGFYNSETNENNLNTCYIIKEDFKLLVSPYESIIITEYPDGTVTEQYNKSNSKIIIVDSIKHLKIVEKELKDLGYNFYYYSQLNEEFLKNIMNIPIFLVIILIIFLIILTNSFVKKKIKEKSKDYAILKITGYNLKDIDIISSIENLVLIIFSLFVGTSIYILIFDLLKNKYLIDYIYQGININFSILSILITLILFIFIVLMINLVNLKKLLNSNVNSILGDS